MMTSRGGYYVKGGPEGDGEGGLRVQTSSRSQCSRAKGVGLGLNTPPQKMTFSLLAEPGRGSSEPM